MYRSIPVSALMLAAVLMTGCGDDDTPTAPTDPPIPITEQFPAADAEPLTLTRNGAATFTFFVQRSGNVSAVIQSLEPADAVIGLSLGPASTQACSASISRDNATLNTQIVGTASAIGAFCVRVYDASGTLSGPVSYRLVVTHF